MSDSQYRVTDWSGDPGETVLCRSRVEFATGAAAPVADSRWFRNTDREDIQHELPGWPEGPVYSLHSAPQRTTRKAGRFAGVAIPALLNAAAEFLGGAGSPFSDPKIMGRPTEPENEVDDFPVMWAAQGTLARSFPWQLDPARRGIGHTTHTVITDHRLILLQQGPDEDTGPEVLLIVPRAHIGTVDAMEFGTGDPDTRIRLVDNSWVRLSFLEQDHIFLHLRAQPDLLREDQLTPAQQASLAAFIAKWPAGDEPPVITRSPGGGVTVELRVPEARARYGYLTQWHAMNDDGEPPAERVPLSG